MKKAATAGVLLLSLARLDTATQDASPVVRIESIVTLPSLGGSRTVANGISELGHVVGSSSTSGWWLHHAFLWSPDGVMLDLLPTANRSAACGVNDRGEVVGYFEALPAYSGVNRPFVWSAEKGFRELIDPARGSGVALAINNAGEILGAINGSGVIWAPDGSETPVGGRFSAYCFPGAMNQFGEVAGSTEAGLFRWAPTTGLTPLGFTGSAADINERGDIAGNGNVDHQPWSHGPFIWAEPGAWAEPGGQALLPGLYGERGATGLNNLQQVVGYAELDEPINGLYEIIFLWAAGIHGSPTVSAVARAEFEEGAIVRDLTDQGAVVGMVEPPPPSSGLTTVIWQLETSASQIADAMRVRITEIARRGLIGRGPARSLLAKLDQTTRTAAPARAAAAHAASVQKEILALSRSGVLPEAHALPLNRLASVLLDKTR